jgi:hypothetical protein
VDEAKKEIACGLVDTIGGSDRVYNQGKVLIQLQGVTLLPKPSSTRQSTVCNLEIRR